MKAMKAIANAVFASASVALMLTIGLVEPSQAQPAITQLFAFACDSNTKLCPDGEQPNSLIQSADGNFYGTTALGGTGSKAAGTVFKITPAGQLTTLYTFVADQNGNFPQGANPTSLVEGNDGFFYGATGAGGANNDGAIFKLSKMGMIQVLHSFCSLPSCADGNIPFNLVLGSDGNLYGCTTYSRPGTLFRVTPSGSYTLLHTFQVSVDGPQCVGMTLASDGKMYGTTVGGDSVPTVLFRLTPAGAYSTLHTFFYSDFPTSRPVQNADGKLYGISRRGLVVSNRSGTIFAELPISGTDFRDFFSYATAASDLNVWSAYYQGGNGLGVLAQISRQASMLQTVPFLGTNGGLLNAPVLQGSDGTLLGVTEEGGSVGQNETANGVVFTLDAGLAPPKPLFVSFKPAQGKIGARVKIQGLNFVGTTDVKFNGVSATFQVLNTGNILATVPSGATSGPIAVTNAGGTTQSNKTFTVQ